MTTELTTYVPINLPDPESLVEGSGLKSDKIKLTFHNLFLSRQKQVGCRGNNKSSNKEYIYNDGYCSVQATTLKSLLGKRYMDYLDLLLKKGLIIARPSPGSPQAYDPGKMCRQYKISPELLHSSVSKRHFRKETITDRATIKAVIRTNERFKANRFKRKCALLDIDHGLINMEKLVRFRTSDVEQNIKTLEEMHPIEDPLMMQIELLHLINDGEFPSSVDIFGERLYTPLKRVSRSLRQHLYFEGFETEQLVELDVRNSQLYFSTLITNMGIISQVAPEFTPAVNLIAEYGKNEDFKKYSELCQNGVVYDYWQDLRKLKSRDIAKKEFIMILFGKVASKHPGVRAFKNHFPSVASAFRVIKESDENTLPFITSTYLDFHGKFKENHTHANLSCLTQRLESRIFMRMIGADLIGKNIMPFFTLHDSIFIPARYENEVRSAIEERFKLLNVPPPTIKSSPVSKN